MNSIFHSRCPALLLALGLGFSAFAQPSLTIGTGSQDVSKAQQRAEELVELRRATRARIDAAKGDEPGPLDSMGGFSRTLVADPKPEFSGQRRTSSESHSSRRLSTLSADPNHSEIEFREEGVSAPLKRLALAAPRPSRREDSFLPDFSRQKMTFAELIGKEVIPLPELDGDSTPVFRSEIDGVPPALSLADLVRIGLDNSDALVQSRSRVSQSGFATKQARSELFPSANYRHSRGPERSRTAGGVDSHTTESIVLQLTQPLIDVPRLRNWQGQRHDENAVRQRHRAAEERVAVQVATAVIDLVVARLGLEFSDEQLVNLEMILDNTRQRVEGGAARRSDLERARTRVLSARQVVVELQSAYRNALFELERLAGQVPAAVHLPTLNELPGLPQSLFELRQLAESNNPEIQALIYEIDAFRLGLESAKGALAPTLGLALERNEGTNVRGTNPTQTDERLVMVLNWSLSLGGRDFFGIGLARAQLAAAESKLKEERKKLLTAVDADFVLLQSSTLRLESARREVDAARQVVDATLEQLRVGRLSSILEALDAVERLQQSRVKLVQTMAQQLQGHSQALGRLGMMTKVVAEARWQITTQP